LKTIRIIPRLDIKGPNLVKGIHLEGLRVLGRPESFARHYYEQGADELLFQDTVASLYQRNNLAEIVKKTAENIFVPLTVGGGIRSLEDINRVLRAGADKVAINTAAIANPDFINKASETFGSSTIVVAVEVIRQADGSYLLYTDNGREHTGINALSWIKEVEQRGAGEILLTSIDSEGTGKGFDLSLLEEVSDLISIPLIAHGGAASVKQIYDAVINGKADAVALASMLHYTTINQLREMTDSSFEEGNIEFLSRGLESSRKFGTHNLIEIKNQLTLLSIPIRELP